MTQKLILVPTRVRRPPATGWLRVDRRFIREHMGLSLWRSRAVVFLPLSRCRQAWAVVLRRWHSGHLAPNDSFHLG